MYLFKKRLVARRLRLSSLTQGPDGTLTGVVSFHSVFSRVLNHPVHTGLRTAYLLHVASTDTDVMDLMEDCLVLAKAVSISESGCPSLFDLFEVFFEKKNKSTFWYELKIVGHFPYLQKGCDLLSALDFMENQKFLEKLKFSISDKRLHFYLYNWTCPKMNPDKVLQPLLLVCL